MNLTPQEQWVADCALGTLRDDDCHPNVGMGMFQGTAIDYAIEAAKEAASIFAGGPEFFLLQFDRKKVEAYVRAKRN